MVYTSFLFLLLYYHIKYIVFQYRWDTSTELKDDRMENYGGFGLFLFILGQDDIRIF